MPGLKKLWKVKSLKKGSGKNIDIEATSFEILFKEFTDKKGKQLSDHYPITSTIYYELIDGILISDIFGGNNGKGFSFIEKIGDQYPLSVTIYTTDQEVNKIGFTYEHFGLVIIGGNGGKKQLINFKKKNISLK
jgi:deoxyhypusine synthase